MKRILSRKLLLLVCLLVILQGSFVSAAITSTPTPYSPGTGSEPGNQISSLTPTLQWSSVSGADYYALAISKYPYGSSNIVYNPKQIYGTSVTVPGNVLVPGEKYRWNMQAHSSAGWSSISSTLYFVSPAITPSPVQVTIYMHEDSSSGPVISGMQITGQDGNGVSFSRTTDSSGAVTISGAPGNWQFSASKAGYDSASWPNSITVSKRLDGYLQKTQVAAAPQAPSPIQVTLYMHEGSSSGPLISGMQITGQDGNGVSFSRTTDSSGAVTISGAPGTWQFSASKAGYDSASWPNSITVSKRLDGYLQKTQVAAAPQAPSPIQVTLYMHEGSSSGPLISGMQITGQDGNGVSFSRTTDSSGAVTISGAPGTWQFSASKAGYDSASWPNSITVSKRLDGYLQKTPVSAPQTPSSVQVTLYMHEGSASGPVISGMQITGHDGNGVSFSRTTDSSGAVLISGSAGNWQFSASKSGYDSFLWQEEIGSDKFFNGYLIASIEDSGQVKNGVGTTDSYSLIVSKFRQDDDTWAGIKLGYNTDPQYNLGDYGCAVTSAAMVLKYYQIPTDPGQLNEALKNKEGFSRATQGDIRWDIVPEISKNEGVNTISLIYNSETEYEFQPANIDKINSYIKRGYPVIAKVFSTKLGNDHWVVITGYQTNAGSTIYSINDPYSNSLKGGAQTQIPNSVYKVYPPSVGAAGTIKKIVVYQGPTSTLPQQIQQPQQVQQVQQTPGSVQVTLVMHDGSASGPLLSGVVVSGHDGTGATFAQTTDNLGTISISVNPGSWQFSATKTGYQTGSWPKVINSDSNYNGFLILSSHASSQAPVAEFQTTPTSGGAQLTATFPDQSTGCDFSKQKGIERCFGGVGDQCRGVFIPFTGIALHTNIFDEKTCYVETLASAGSIIHDRCCKQNPDGKFCNGVNFWGSGCEEQWNEAEANYKCPEDSPRQWNQKFGPYLVGNLGDDTTIEIRAPPGTRVNPEYQEVCQSGKCTIDTDGKTLKFSDNCGEYCICQDGTKYNSIPSGFQVQQPPKSSPAQSIVTTEESKSDNWFMNVFFNIFPQSQKQPEPVLVATTPILSATVSSTDTPLYSRASPATYNQPPVKPYPLSPGNGYEPGESVYTRTPTLTWKGADKAEYYSLAISKSPYGSDNIVYSQQEIYGTSHTIPDNILEIGENYRWNMYAYNSAGKSEVSWTLYFNVKP